MQSPRDVLLLAIPNLRSLLFGLVAAANLSTCLSLITPTPADSPDIVTWLIDGNNLKCSRGVPDDRCAIIQELQQIASSRQTQTVEAKSTADSPMIIANVVLVFDGDHNEILTRTVSPHFWFQVVVTDGRLREKDRADNYMIDTILPELQSTAGRVHLVSADKELAKRAEATRLMRGGSTVHPPKFWNHYLPNLQARQRQLQEQKIG